MPKLFELNIFDNFPSHKINLLKRMNCNKIWWWSGGHWSRGSVLNVQANSAVSQSVSETRVCHIGIARPPCVVNHHHVMVTTVPCTVTVRQSLPPQLANTLPWLPLYYQCYLPLNFVPSDWLATYHNKGSLQNNHYFNSFVKLC